MSSLDISEEKAKKFSKIEDSALDIIQEYFDGTREGGDEIITARCMISAVKGNRQAETVKHSLNFNMVQMVADENQLKKYVKASCPEIKKLLQ
jgi:hypothetical protein